jgi:hypothetical protein
MSAEKEEFIVGPTLIITNKADESVRIHATIGQRTRLREEIPVQHALPDDYGGEGYPIFSENEKRYFINNGIIPISELQYLLTWANKLRQDTGEDAFDFPTGRAQFEMSDVILRKYTKPYFPEAGVIFTENTQKELDYGTVPLSLYKEFLELHRPPEVPKWKQKAFALYVSVRKFFDRFRQKNPHYFFNAKIYHYPYNQNVPDREVFIRELDTLVGFYLKK